MATDAPAHLPTGAPTVSFELTPEDWVEVALQHDGRSEHLRTAKRTIRLLWVAIVLLLALLSLMQGSSAGALTWVLGGAFVLAILDPLLRHSRRSQLRKLAGSGIANGMFGPHRVELRPEGIIDVTEGYEWLTRWSAIERVEDGEGSFLVYYGPNALLPIPHSAFPDAASMRRFGDAFFALKEGAGAGTEGTVARLPAEPSD